MSEQGTQSTEKMGGDAMYKGPRCWVLWLCPIVLASVHHLIPSQLNEWMNCTSHSEIEQLHRLCPLPNSLNSKICLNLLGYDTVTRGGQESPYFFEGSWALHPPLPSSFVNAFVYSVNVGVWGRWRTIKKKTLSYPLFFILYCLELELSL